MSQCEQSRGNDPNDPFSRGGVCFCPALMISHYRLTLEELTYVMEREQPTTWTDERGFCGDESENCAEPVCIPLPR